MKKVSGFSELENKYVRRGRGDLIDIHCHILSGMDDGAKDLKESVEMARHAYKDGIRHIIATPHHCRSIIVRPEVQLAKVAELQRALQREKIDVTVTPGNEVRMESAEFVYENEATGKYLYLDPGKKFILLEQRWSGYEDRSEEIFSWFLSRGTQPILAHPERHGFFRDQPELLYRILDLGVWAQVNVDSLLGKNGEDAKKFARKLIRQNRTVILASDAHSIRRRWPNLSEGVHLFRKLAGKEAAYEMLDRLEQVRQSAVRLD